MLTLIVCRSRSVDFVVAETQTSQQYLPQQETTEHHSRHSLSGTSTSTSSPTSIHSKSSDPIVVTSDATTTLSTDPEISEGEYLLAHTEARSDPVMASCEVPEVSEGEFAASPGDIRYMRGKTRSEITSQSLRYHQGIISAHICLFNRSYVFSWLMRRCGGWCSYPHESLFRHITCGEHAQ